MRTEITHVQCRREEFAHASDLRAAEWHCRGVFLPVVDPVALGAGPEVVVFQ